MNLTKIDWCDYTWNPITGCTNSCEYCYARKIARRFPEKFNGFKPTFHENRLIEPYKTPPPKKRKPWIKKAFPNTSLTFTVSMGDMFAAPDFLWINKILGVFWDCNPYDKDLRLHFDHKFHIFQVLTKFPSNLWHYLPHDNLPMNLWLGVTVNFNKELPKLDYLTIHRRGIRFVSFEPLFEEIREALLPRWLDWIIIGGMTGSRKMNCETNPEMRSWIENIINFADKLDIPVFIKDNAKYPEKIRKFPYGGEI